MKKCPSCQQENSLAANFCSNCGFRLSDSNDSPSAFDGSPIPKKREAERRQLTILFCDLVGSTPLSQKLDPEDYRNMITNYHQVAEKAIKSYGGHVAQYLGDGLLVYFGYPEGLEDAAKMSIKAGLGIIEAMQKSNQKATEKGFPAIQIRIGIHSGLVVVDDHLALGETVNVAARLEGVAPPNGLVISPQTMQLTQGWFNINSTGIHNLKGISNPMEVFQVLSESGAKTRLDIAKERGLSPLVGRASDLKLLLDGWNKAIQSEGQVVLLHGEAGIGKSRLVDTMEAKIASYTGVNIAVARCSSYHQSTAFYAISGMVREELFKLTTEGEENQQNASIIYELSNLLSGKREFVAYLLDFLSIPSEEYPKPKVSPGLKRQKILEGISLLLIKLSLNQPLFFILEDLHWADASTLEWLDHFVPIIQDKPIFILGTTRPGDAPGWLKHDHVSVQYLKRLSAEEMLTICVHQSKGKSLPKEILHQIAMKTEGVPLFVEELTKMILTSDFIKEEEAGYEIVGSISNISIPSTLQDSLLARLDKLSHVKEIVQIGSVLGREFTYSLLKILLADKKVSTEEGLRKLVDAEILYQKGKGKDAVFLFKHALIQDAAYESLLKSKRQKMHLQIADVLATQFPTLVKEQPQLLAFHYTEGGNPRKAIPLWLSAGQQSSQKNASLEAITHLKTGLSLLTHIENEKEKTSLELNFLLTLGGMYIVSHGFPHAKVKETFDKARDVAQKVEVSPMLALIMVNLMSYYMNTEDYSSHAELSSHMVPLTKDKENGYWFKIFLNQLGGGGNVIKGEYFEACNSYKELLEIFDPTLPFAWELASCGYVEIGAKAWQMICLQVLGRFKEARQLANDHLLFADFHKDSMTLYHIHTFPALFHLEAGEWEIASEIIENYLPVVREFGDPVFILTAEVYHSIAEAFLGDRSALDKAVNLMNTCFQIGFSAFAVSLSSYISELYLKYNDYKLSLEWSERILIHVSASGSHAKTCELLRCKAMAIYELKKPNEKPEDLLKEAILLAQKQQAKLYELRSSYALAKIWRENGRASDAKKLLNDIYVWFEPDLKSIDLALAGKLLEKMDI